MPPPPRVRRRYVRRHVPPACAAHRRDGSAVWCDGYCSTLSYHSDIVVHAAERCVRTLFEENCTTDRPSALSFVGGKRCCQKTCMKHVAGRQQASVTLYSTGVLAL